ncbi:MAG: adenylate/guanylate cyclase domain-containing protein, partial [Planctomycetes bacterium]|nr:adenylate/guanylate cyclase domain-containing protein [Planctomycetota bacterium]
MAQDRLQRKVTVILATDVVGYSNKIEQNEDQTLETLRACRAIIEELIDEHHGRVFNTAGDSVLAEFPSAVEAVLCAAEFQRSIKERNASIEDKAQQMEFRVGINMGDVVIEETNLYGDGVNVAARLEALGQPGGICLAKNVYDIVHKKMDLTFTDLGDQQVKNTVVHAVDVSLEGVSPRKLPGTKKARSSKRIAYLLAGLALIVLIAASGFWWSQMRPDFEPANLSKYAFQLPGEPSIAVMPFNNLSGDPTQDHIGDGLTENIISVLSSSSTLVVTPRNASFRFKGKATSVQEIAEQLGVRYVLEGSVQQSGDKLRVTAQIVDAVDGKHLWGERYDRKLDDLFEIQDDITYQIWQAMETNLTIGAQAGQWAANIVGGMAEAQLLLRGRSHFLKFTPEGHREAERLWSEAFEKRSESGLVNFSMAMLNYQKILMNWTDDPRSSIATAKYHANKAHTMMGDAGSVAVLGMIEMLDGNCEASNERAERSVEIDPSAGQSMSMAGTSLIVCGKAKEGVDMIRRSMDLQPETPTFLPISLSLGLLVLEEYEEAEEILKGTLQSKIKHAVDRMSVLGNMVVVNYFKGEEKEATEYVDQILALDSNATVAMYRRKVF